MRLTAESFVREGWIGDNYLILFDDQELDNLCRRYAVALNLPGFVIVGLCGWDDCLVRNSKGDVFCVPAVPMYATYLVPFLLPEKGAKLEADNLLAGKVKWYIKPLVFGGDPSSTDNITWIDFEHHAELVRWWNVHCRAHIAK
jgi:hypothetical protein